MGWGFGGPGAWILEVAGWVGGAGDRAGPGPGDGRLGASRRGVTGQDAAGGGVERCGVGWSGGGGNVVVD